MEDTSAPCSGTSTSAASTVGTADISVGFHCAAMRQKPAITALLRNRPVVGMMTWAPAEKQADRKGTRLNSSHLVISYAVFCLKKKTNAYSIPQRRVYSTHTPQPILHGILISTL